MNGSLRYVRCLAKAHSLSSDVNIVLPCSRIFAQACSYGLWQSLPQINSSFSLLLYLTHPIFVLPLALFPPTLLLSRAILPYWFCEVQWPEHGTGTGKGVGSIPAKLQVFIGLSVWDNLSAGLHHRPRWYILFCNWCPCCQLSLQAGGSRQKLQDAPHFHWCGWKHPKTTCLHDRLLPSISLLWDSMWR